jgi:hypothetical protein
LIGVIREVNEVMLERASWQRALGHVSPPLPPQTSLILRRLYADRGKIKGLVTKWFALELLFL